MVKGNDYKEELVDVAQEIDSSLMAMNNNMIDRMEELTESILRIESTIYELNKTIFKGINALICTLEDKNRR